MVFLLLTQKEETFESPLHECALSNFKCQFLPQELTQAGVEEGNYSNFLFSLQIVNVQGNVSS